MECYSHAECSVLEVVDKMLKRPNDPCDCAVHHTSHLFESAGHEEWGGFFFFCFSPFVLLFLLFFDGFLIVDLIPVCLTLRVKVPREA